MGWVSIFHEDGLREVLGIPTRIVRFAYLCVGHVSRFNDQPDLQSAGWQERLHVEDLAFFDQWGREDMNQPLIEHLRSGLTV